MNSKIIIIGPAHPFRGGLATFDHRLCREFVSQGHECSIITFTLQYPSFLFPGTTQYSKDPEPEDIKIYPLINSIHPINWWQVGDEIKRMRPDLVVVRYWLPFMGPALGTIARQIRKNKHTRVIAITDNILPHEKRIGDKAFTRYFLKSCDGFVTMSSNVMDDLRLFEKTKPAMQVAHPLYDNFGTIVSKEEARRKLELPADLKLILFFGFIRKYKGLDILLDAMPSVLSRHPECRLIVAGEFYEDGNVYQHQIKKLGIEQEVILRTDFIPDAEVRFYFSAADVVIQPYRNATQSGVTPLAYHFEKPMIVTNVGSLPHLVPHEKVGLVAQPNPASLSAAIDHYFELGEEYFLPHLRNEKEKYSWSKLVNSLIQLSHDVSQ